MNWVARAQRAKLDAVTAAQPPPSPSKSVPHAVEKDTLAVSRMKAEALTQVACPYSRVASCG